MTAEVYADVCFKLDESLTQFSRRLAVFIGRIMLITLQEKAGTHSVV
jgi:hypothetical protein